jgi:hypothetical protein
MAGCDMSVAAHCDKPAERCDVDHTTPWPLGPMHPSNTKAYCRTHELLKTFGAARVLAGRENRSNGYKTLGA